ncbi:hypothetical protein KK120_09605 [Virgibacillus dakarensis]|nr:hypothetical protein [Virgibacillus dakarensis]
MSQKTYYYVHGHTASGKQDFSQSNIKNIKNVFVLTHPSLKVKTAVIRKFANFYEGQLNLEIIKSVHGNDYLDGLIVRNKSIALFTESTPEFEDMLNVNLGNFFDIKNTDYEVLDKEKLAIENAYNDFSAGLKIHDDLEEIFISQMDFARADELTKEFIEKLLYSQPISETKGHTYHRLFGTNTSDGVVNVVPEIIQGVNNVYFIKGRAGTGKSTFMKKIANACTEHGLDIELYHCSFDPNSIDMVLVRDLDFCIFDSTDPHEFFPKKDGDRIIDLYEELVTPGTDEEYADKISELNNRYKSYMKKGIENLKKAGQYRDQIEEKYALPDENEFNKVVENIINQIS